MSGDRMMRKFDDMDALPAFRSPVVTVGSFDGVHRGHQFLLDTLRERAAALGGETVVVTFDRHPRRVLETDGDLMVLTGPEEKAWLIAEAGIDNLVVMPFDRSVAGMSAEEFVRDVLVGRLGVRELVVGYNHRLGHDRQGDAAILDGLGKKYGFRVFQAPKFTDDSVKGGDNSSGSGSEKISSTAIRRALANGDTASAERMLGRQRPQ